VALFLTAARNIWAKENRTRRRGVLSMIENIVTITTFVQFVSKVTNLTQLLLFCG